MRGFSTLLVGLVVAMGSSVAAQEDVRPAKVITIAQSSGVLNRTYPASILPSEEVELSFRVGGRVSALEVRGSMQVAKGDLIAQLDQRDFEAQVAQLQSQRDQAAAQLQSLRAGLLPEEIAALEAAVASAQAQFDQALDQAERTRQLVERNVSAPAVLEQDEANLRVAEANLNAQKEQLAVGQAGARVEDIAASEAALRAVEAQLQAAQNNLSDTSLVAPFAGLVARRDIDNFANIQAGQSVVLLQKLDILHLTFDVPGPDVTALSARGVEQVSFVVAFDALPGQSFDAEVVEFSLQADAATQTYRGRVAVPQPENIVLLPGMIGRVTASAPTGRAAMLVPLTAIAADPAGQPFVWKVSADNTVTRQEIELGAANGAEAEVLSGLDAGDRVVTAGVSKLLEGMEIRPVTRIGG